MSVWEPCVVTGAPQLLPVQGQRLFETYHGVYVNIECALHCRFSYRCSVRSAQGAVPGLHTPAPFLRQVQNRLRYAEAQNAKEFEGTNRVHGRDFGAHGSSARSNLARTVKARSDQNGLSTAPLHHFNTFGSSPWGKQGCIISQ